MSTFCADVKISARCFVALTSTPPSYPHCKLAGLQILTPLKKNEDVSQNDSSCFITFDSKNPDYEVQHVHEGDASYDALGIGAVVDVSKELSAENSLNENRLEIDSIDCSNENLPDDSSRDVTCCDPLEISSTVDKPQPEDENKSTYEAEAMELDETIVDQSAVEHMSVAFEESADLDISDLKLESFSTSAAMEKEIGKMHEQSLEEKAALREKTKNIINLKKYYEASSEDLQYLFWQKALLDDEFERNSELAVRDIEKARTRTERIQQQIDIIEELTFENSELKEMQERVKLLIELIHKKNEKINSLSEDVDGRDQEMAQIKRDEAELERFREENRNLIDKLTSENRVLSENVEKLTKESRESAKKLSSENRILSENVEKLAEENGALAQEITLLKNRQVEKQVEYLNLLKELQEVKIAHESDLNKLNAMADNKRKEEELEVCNQNLLKELDELKIARENDLNKLNAMADNKRKEEELEVCNQNLLKELDELKIARENDLAKLKLDIDDEIKAEESKAFNYYVALKMYEESWNTFYEKYESMRKSNHKMSDDLGILEVAFKNVVDKFEKSKSLIEGYRSNEAIYEENMKKYKAKLEEEHERYRDLKDHATKQFDEGNKKYMEVKVISDTNFKKQSAIIRRLEIKLSATEDLLRQKNTECDRLAKLCDEVTGSV